MNFLTTTVLPFLVILLLSHFKIGKAQIGSNAAQGQPTVEYATSAGWLNDVVSSVSNAAAVAAQNIKTAKTDVTNAVKDGSLKKAAQNAWQSVSQALNNSIQSAKNLNSNRF